MDDSTLGDVVWAKGANLLTTIRTGQLLLLLEDANLALDHLYHHSLCCHDSELPGDFVPRP